jgi:hypothetical protein
MKCLNLTICLLLNKIFCAEPPKIMTLELKIGPERFADEIRFFLKYSENFDVEKMIHDSESLIKERVEFNYPPSQELLDLVAKELKGELSQDSQFYNYCYVLSLIDKSISLIGDLKNNTMFNLEKLTVVLDKEFENVDLSFKKSNEFLEEVKKLYDERKNADSMEIVNIWDELIRVRNSILDLEMKFEGQKDFPNKEYQSAIIERSRKLKTLQKNLEEIREKLYPMGEEDIQMNDDLFKNNFARILSEIFENLSEFTKRADDNLNVLCEILKNISEINEGFINELESCKKKLGE